MLIQPPSVSISYPSMRLSWIVPLRLCGTAYPNDLRRVRYISFGPPPQRPTTSPLPLCSTLHTVLHPCIRNVFERREKRHAIQSQRLLRSRMCAFIIEGSPLRSAFTLKRRHKFDDTHRQGRRRPVTIQKPINTRLLTLLFWRQGETGK